MGYGWCRWLKVVKLCSYGALPIHLFRHFCHRMYRLATMHSITDRQTDKQTDDSIIMPDKSNSYLHHLSVLGQ